MNLLQRVLNYMDRDFLRSEWFSLCVRFLIVNSSSLINNVWSTLCRQLCLKIFIWKDVYMYIYTHTQRERDHSHIMLRCWEWIHVVSYFLFHIYFDISKNIQILSHFNILSFVFSGNRFSQIVQADNICLYIVIFYIRRNKGLKSFERTE